MDDDGLVLEPPTCETSGIVGSSFLRSISLLLWYGVYNESLTLYISSSQIISELYPLQLGHSAIERNAMCRQGLLG